MKHLNIITGLIGIVMLSSTTNTLGQICNPLSPPVNLSSVYTPGSGAVLNWDIVPGSVGVQIKATAPGGAMVSRRIVGFERSSFFVPDALLSPGTYSWQVQAACSTTPPYAVTPISAVDFFTKAAPPCPSLILDIDGNSYPIITIGTQCWMAENLKTERYRNGDPIPTGLTNTAWESTGSGAFALYEDIAANKNTYGLLYNWYAVADPRSLCPAGWHVPSDAELSQLITHVGGTASAGGALKETGTIADLFGACTTTGLWQCPNLGATNSSGFKGRPGGTRNTIGQYTQRDVYGYFWSATEFNAIGSWYMILFRNDAQAPVFNTNKHFGMSVRCLRD